MRTVEQVWEIPRMAPHAFALLIGLLALPVQSASAQGFLDFLFGSDGPSPSRSAGGYARSGPGFSAHEAPSPFSGLFGSGSYDRPPPYERTTYRTLCVRMCDGFYFPISYATGSSNFTRDAETCAASCGGEARLFYYPNPGGNIEGMLDMTGRAYASYPTAFRYRRTLVQGCQCRPQPWTEAERARHRTYAAAQSPQESQSALSNGAPAGSPNAAADPSLATDVLAGAAARGDFHAIARPDPIQRQTRTGQWDWLSGPSGSGPAAPARSRYSWPGMR